MKDYSSAMKDWTSLDETGLFKFESPGDQIYGTLKQLGYEDGQYGPQLTMVLDTDDGTLKVYCPAALRREVEENMPAVGMDVACKYFGMGESRSGREFKKIGFRILDTNGVQPGEIPVAEPKEPASDTDDIPF